MSKFKVGDKVRKNTPSNRMGPLGLTEDIVTGCTDNTIYLKESFWQIPDELELVKLEKVIVGGYDTVIKPEHYNHGDGIECIEYIKQVLGKEGFIAYCRGNAMKYQHRAMYKGKAVEDLEKAQQYSLWDFETLKDETNE